MKYLQIIFISLVLSICGLGQQIESNQIVIKTHNEVSKSFLKQYLADNYSHLFGDVKTSYYIQNENLLFPKSNDNLQNGINKRFLRRIFKINYSKNTSPVLIVNKIQNDPIFEYVEPVYKREFSFVPNDSLINEQYHLTYINAWAAWDLEFDADSVIIGIVDTGVELDHEDLKEKIFTNDGEMGLDQNGNDKRENGIDDDENGYVDDWRGWDLVASSNTLGYDNDPNPGSDHGTHVAGITAAMTNNVKGIAGIADKAKILAVKIGRDEWWSRSVENGYEGILYAAMMGADVINCSWGGGGYSNAENEMIQLAREFGCLIVAAAGNDNTDKSQYPASYEGVISVASTDKSDNKSNFSNYHSSVDISAPGSRIMSTVLANGYKEASGTSMASPVVAGIAAVLHQYNPELSYDQLGDQLLASSDTFNQFGLDGKLGKGRINMYRAMIEDDAKNINLNSYSFSKLSDSDIYLPGDEVRLDFELSNILRDVNNTSYSFTSETNLKENQTNNINALGDFEVGRVSSNIETFTLPDDLPVDYSYKVYIDLEGEDYTDNFVLNLDVNESYRTIETDVFTVTANSRGNIAYNDFPANDQGQGFKYKDSDNLLYEGAMIVTSNSFNISSVARSEFQGQQYRDFSFINAAQKIETLDQIIIKSQFTDNALEGKAGVEIEKEHIAYKEGELSKVIILRNIIKNIQSIDVDSLFIGYYYDWDIGLSGTNNICEYNKPTNIIYQYNADDESLPKVAAGILSDHDFIGYALDNDGSSTINPGVYDGFSYDEQRRIIKGELIRHSSAQTDVSMLFSAGPISLKAGEQDTVEFVLMVSEEISDFVELQQKAKDQYNLSSLEEKWSSIDIYPNPTNGITNIDLEIDYTGEIDINLFDLNGNKVYQVFDGFFSNQKSLSINTNSFIPGAYVLSIKYDNVIKSRKIIIN